MANSVTPLFDIGANLLDSQLSKNFNEIITRSKENNIRKIIITSSHIDDTYQAKELIDREPDLLYTTCLLYTSPSPRDKRQARMPSSA